MSKHLVQAILWGFGTAILAFLSVVETFVLIQDRFSGPALSAGVVYVVFGEFLFFFVTKIKDGYR